MIFLYILNYQILINTILNSYILIIHIFFREGRFLMIKNPAALEHPNPARRVQRRVAIGESQVFTDEKVHSPTQKPEIKKGLYF
jgi:hypothetical protein